jgi:SAM-dependent methyltransferase
MAQRSTSGRTMTTSGRQDFERGSRALYERPLYYDQAYRRHTQDLAFYVGLARRARGPVLELGTGTGRVSLALARAGVSVVGLDQSRDMLRQAETRIAREPSAVRRRIELRAGDLRSARLRRRFALVIAPFNLFMHLYTRRDLERGLATVRAHLAERGRFAMDVLVPDLGALRRDPERVYRCRPVFDPTDGKRHAYGEAYSYDPVRQIQTVRMLFQRLDKPEIDRETPLSLRCYFPEELCSLLHYNGFAVVARYGDFSGGPLGSHSENQIVVARARRKP